MKKHYKSGVVAGKFNPPHLGHLFFIETAAASCDSLYVILCDRVGQTIAAADRASWLADAVPDNCSIIVTADDIPNDSKSWGIRTRTLLSQHPDVAFTSESYGETWAAAMGCAHELIDKNRLTVPVRATDIRVDLRRQFHLLLPAARAALARRIVIIGAESCGKTTLAAALAQHFKTVWVPEHGRWYWEGRRYLRNHVWQEDEFVNIAMAQSALEDNLARHAHQGFVFADTDALVTAVWQKRYTKESESVQEIAQSRVPDVYIACAADFDWVQDGSRESHEHRQWMQNTMLDAARNSGAPVLTVDGPHGERMATAIEYLESSISFPPLV